MAAAERAVKHAANAAIAAAAEVAVVVAPAEAALFDGQQQQPRGSWTSRSASRQWVMQIQGSMVQGKVFKLGVQSGVQTGVQAACAADLARLAILGSSAEAAAELNFPASVYTQQQVAAMAALLQLKHPALKLAACTQGSSSSSTVPSVLPAACLLRSAEREAQRAQLRAAADAAVRMAAKAAEATEAAAPFSSDVDGPVVGSGFYFIPELDVHEMRVHRGSDRAREAYMRQYRSPLHAACAADLAQLALGRATVNLPGDSYTAEQVADMQQLLQFERPGLFEWAGARHTATPEAAAYLQDAVAAARKAVAAATAAAVEAAPEQAAAYRAARQHQQQQPVCCRPLKSG
uniref:Uncharacterized protein n=1 Tax=Tetradesmus obliquus TaxID=3088 RepID=A0A383VQD9_TETOB|eukprot:jgi/Sobl393_1/9701/SZX67748.1